MIGESGVLVLTGVERKRGEEEFIDDVFPPPPPSSVPFPRLSLLPGGKAYTLVNRQQSYPIV